MKFKPLFLLILVTYCLNAYAEENPLPQLYKKLLPSVVTLHTFKNKITNGTTNVVASSNGLGSGVIISDDGLIITAAHVVHTSDILQVEFENEIVMDAKVISSIPWADLALVKVNSLPDTAGVSKLGDSKKVRIGEQIFVIGAPLGLSKTLTVGYISATHKPGSLKSAPLAEFFQTDAAINPGNSGGPMFNLSGEVIGIASQIKSQSGGNQGLGFVVTSDTVKNLLLGRGHFWSGIDVFPLSIKLANAFHLPQNSGVLIQRVANGSIAQKAGLKGGKIPAEINGKSILLGGDIILSINDKQFNSKQSIRDIMQSIISIKPGSLLKVVIWRSGNKETIQLEVP